MQPSHVGQPIRVVVAASGGARTEIYDAKGRKVDKLPDRAKGSVSIHNRDETGQDNYTFDESGVIVRQQRSYGEDYSEGRWQEVK